MVAIRSMGLSFESLVGTMDSAGRKSSIVSPDYLKMLVRIANERFVENQKRIARFLEELRHEIADAGAMADVSRADEKELRRESKRAEGLRRQAEARSRREEKPVAEIDSYIDDLAQDTNLS
jgi:tRNA wybutosine-synthesizing protein 3